MKIFTHCHSSTVEAIIVKAWKQGKKFEVYNTETRPKFQGRKTATNLAKEGIPVTHFVDSAGRSMLRKTDLFLFGCDAITSEGKLINKIGTEMLAQTARESSIPAYSCTNSWKFDPNTLYGFDEEIEQRDPNEVWVLHMIEPGPFWSPGCGEPGCIWVAQRVPDDHVAIIPNGIEIGNIDFDDPDNFMYSSNIKSFAEEMGWYDPESGLPFNFIEVYTEGKPTGWGVAERQWRGYQLLAPSLKLPTPDEAYTMKDSNGWPYRYPFSVKAERKISAADLMSFYRDHGAHQATPPMGSGSQLRITQTWLYVVPSPSKPLNS